MLRRWKYAKNYLDIFWGALSINKNMTCFFCVTTNPWAGLCFRHYYLLLNGVGINKKWFYSSESSATLVAVLAITQSECQMCFSSFWSLAIPRMPVKQPAHSLLGGEYQIASHLIGPHLISIRNQRLTEKKSETMKATPEIYGK